MLTLPVRFGPMSHVFIMSSSFGVPCLPSLQMFASSEAEAPLTFKNSPLCVVRFGLEMALRMHK